MDKLAYQLVKPRVKQAKATICWNHVFHQKFSKMVCGRAGHYHYPLYMLEGFLIKEMSNDD